MLRKKSWFIHTTTGPTLQKAGPYSHLEMEWMRELGLIGPGVVVIERDLGVIAQIIMKKFAIFIVVFASLIATVYGLCQLYAKLYEPQDIPLSINVNQTKGITVTYGKIDKVVPYTLYVQGPQSSFQHEGVLETYKTNEKIEKWKYLKGSDLTPGKYHARVTLYPKQKNKIKWIKDIQFEIKTPKIPLNELHQRYSSLKMLVEKVHKLYLDNNINLESFTQEYTTQWGVFLRDLGLRPLEHYNKDDQDKILKLSMMIGEKMTKLIDETRQLQGHQQNQNKQKYWSRNFDTIIDLLNTQVNSYQ